MAYMILVAIDDVKVLINGFTFLFIQHVQTETPRQDEIHDPIILNGAAGKDNNNPIIQLLFLNNLYVFKNSLKFSTKLAKAKTRQGKGMISNDFRK